jgi:threonine synthase
MSIWKYKLIESQLQGISKVYTLNEGNTPTDEISDSATTLFLKREDKNPTGSWKDRGTAFKLTKLIADEYNEAVLFSSGNALISILTYIKELNLNFKMHAVVSNKVNSNKLNIIQELINGTENQLHISENPKKEAISISAQLKIPNLRVSIDNDIVKGYWSLGFELMELIKNDNLSECGIFLPASSGTAAVGIAEGILLKTNNENNMPRIFICQTQSTHPFVENSEDESSEPSLADAIVDKVGLRVSQIKKIINQTNSDIFIITNDEIIEAQEFMNAKGIKDLSNNSLLSVAGYLRAKKNGVHLNKAILIASGR